MCGKVDKKRAQKRAMTATGEMAHVKERPTEGMLLLALEVV
jgi:hypothetical protein